MTTYVEILNCLQVDENVSGVVFGVNIYGESTPTIPNELLGKRITWEKAAGYFTTFHLRDIIAPPTFYLWTNKRVLFISRYDGGCGLRSVPIHPQDCEPQAFGGW